MALGLASVQTSLTLLSLLLRLSFALPQSRLGRVQTSLTLLSLLLRFSRFFLIVLLGPKAVCSFQARNGYACINRSCLKLQTNARKSMRYKQGFCWFWFMLTQKFTGDPTFFSVLFPFFAARRYLNQFEPMLFGANTLFLPPICKKNIGSHEQSFRFYVYLCSRRCNPLPCRTACPCGMHRGKH